MLHLSKVAFGAASLELLAARVAARAEGGSVAITTRYRPTRHQELVGGSLYWIIKHRLVARQTILGFADADGGRCDIRLDARLVAVAPRPRRAHQGWRYLTEADAPPDLAGGGDLAELPTPLLEALRELALV